MKESVFLQRARAEISNDPLSRIADPVKRIKDEAGVLYDTHMHIFDKNYAAKNFFLLRLIEAFDNKKTNAELIDLIYERHADNAIDDLFKIMDFNSMKGIIDYYYKNFSYQPNMIVVPLTMDLRSWILKPKKSMQQQINEMKGLMNHYPILPFLATDPSAAQVKGNGNLYSLFLKAFTGDNKFFGVKIYPALGYLPSHPALLPIYKICEEKRIPVTTHCGGTIIRAKDTKVKLEGYKIENNELVFYTDVPPKRPKKFATYMNNPALWEPVMKMFPKLKLNLGHFGGVDVWEPQPDDDQKRFATISGLLQNYENVYADFSYNFAKRETLSSFLNTLKSNPVFNQKALFGTDFWMVLAAGDAKDDQVYFVDEAAKMGLKETLMKTNPTKFLYA